MNDDEFLSCLGYNLTDSSNPCPSDSGIDLSSMELDLWSLNCNSNLNNLQRVDSSLFKGDIEEAKTIPMESSEMFQETTINQCNSYGNGNGNGNRELRHGYMGLDGAYFSHYHGTGQYQANSDGKISSSPPHQYSTPPSPRSSTPVAGVCNSSPVAAVATSSSFVTPESTLSTPSSSSSSSSSAASVNSISYSFHPTIQMNPTLCPGQTQPHHQIHSNYFCPSPTNGHIAVSQQGMFPTSMSVNLSMNMTMGFSASQTDQCQSTWPTSTNHHHSNVNYASNGGHCPPSSSPMFIKENTAFNHASTSPSSTGQAASTAVNIGPAYYETPYSPSYSSPLSYGYQMSDLREASEGLNVHGGEKDYGEMRQSVRSGSPLSERSVNEMNVTVRYNYHKGKIAQELAAIQELSRESEDGNCIKGGPNNVPPNLCRICGKTYARPSTLKTHLRTHSGERPYRCNTCNKSFSQAANLTAHIRTHSGEKPFRCPVCDRRFSQSSSVTTHMRTHSGERPYRCCMCKKAFSDSSTLTKHLRIHSGEKPYQCKLCLLRFSQSGNLNRHMRIHANIS